MRISDWSSDVCSSDLAEAKFRSARSFLVESWQSIADGLAAGQPATVRQITSAKLGMRHIHDVVSEVGTFAYRTARGTSPHDGLMQRVYRDLHRSEERRVGKEWVGKGIYLCLTLRER